MHEPRLRFYAVYVSSDSFSVQAGFPNWSILEASLNPGPFTIKEHVILTIMSLTIATSHTCILFIQPVYYDQMYDLSCKYHPFDW